MIPAITTQYSSNNDGLFSYKNVFFGGVVVAVALSLLYKLGKCICDYYRRPGNSPTQSVQSINTQLVQGEEGEEINLPIEDFNQDVLGVAFSFLGKGDIYSCLQVCKENGNWRTALGVAIKTPPHLLNKCFSHHLNASVTKNGVDTEVLEDRLGRLNISLKYCQQNLTELVLSSMASVDFVSKDISSFSKVNYLFFDRSLSKQKKEITEKFSVPEGEIQKPQLIFDYFKPFGAAAWKKYFGVEVVGEVPLCSDWPDKTGYSVLIPSRVRLSDGRVVPFTLNLFKELIKQSNQEFANGYRYYSDKIKEIYGEASSERSHWVSLSRDVINDSRRQSRDYHLKMIEELNNETGINYSLPSVREVVPVLYAVNAVTRDCPYGINPWTYTRCLELVEGRWRWWPVFVGGFFSEGVFIHYRHDDNRNTGLAIIQKD